MILYKEEYDVGQEKKKKDVIDRLLDQIDFHGITAEELAGENGLFKKLTSRFYSRALDAEMDEHLGHKKMTMPVTIPETARTVTQEKLL